jgi:hypothetical protein
VRSRHRRAAERRRVVVALDDHAGDYRSVLVDGEPGDVEQGPDHAAGEQALELGGVVDRPVEVCVVDVFGTIRGLGSGREIGGRAVDGAEPEARRCGRVAPCGGGGVLTQVRRGGWPRSAPTSALSPSRRMRPPRLDGSSSIGIGERTLAVVVEPVTVDVSYEERYWYPEDGGEVWLAGYHILDPASGRFLARDAPELAACGLRVAGVAGAGRHHAEALGGDAVAPGRPLVLRRDHGNPHDEFAIAVHAAAGEPQVGWVPRELAAELAPELDAGRPWSAVVLREQRPSPRDPRTGLTMLLAPAPAIVLRTR